VYREFPVVVEGGRDLEIDLEGLPEEQDINEPVNADINVQGGVNLLNGREGDYEVKVDWGDDNTDTAQGRTLSTGAEATILSNGDETKINITHTYSREGTYTVKATVWDATSKEATTEEKIKVTLDNNVPIANDQTVTTQKGKSAAITLTGSDPDGDTLTYFVVSQPAHGNLSGTPPALTYTPDASYTGKDSFTFKVNDGQVDSNVATVSITVTSAPEEYMVYYIENLTCLLDSRYIQINTRNVFEKPEFRCNFPGGGINCSIELEKVEMRGGFSTKAEATDWVCGQVDSFGVTNFVCPGNVLLKITGRYFYGGNFICDLSGIPNG
jgi:hypothetical protein